MHADGAAVHDPAHAVLCRRLDEGPHAAGVDRAVGLVGQARLAIERRDVVDDVDIPGRPVERRRVGQVALDERHAAFGERARPGLVAHERPHALTAADQRTRQMAPRKPRRAGD